MNQNVFNYLNEKVNDVMDFFHTKFDAVGTYLTDHAHDIQQGLVKGTAGVLTAAALLGGMTGCQQNRPVNPNETKPPVTTPVDPNAPVKSESGLFFGVPYDQDDLPPAIDHRTEEEIEQTGLTAQDVLNAYDQLAIDIAKAMYSTNKYDRLSDEARENITAEFINIAPFEAYYYNPETNNTTPFYAPFFALEQSFSVKHSWHQSRGNSFPAYPISITINTYVDGVEVQKSLSQTGVEPSYLEQTLTSLGNTTPYLLDREKLKDMTTDETYYEFNRYIGQNVYEPMIISRETISTANSEQLKAIYEMLKSIRSITLNQQPLPTSDLELSN